MGLTLIAILTGALLLPGIIAARAFYQAGGTTEVQPVIPTLSSSSGIALVGMFSAFCHLMYVVTLWFAGSMPRLVGLPLANPYMLFVEAGLRQGSLTIAWSLFMGLFWLSGIAVVSGFITGKLVYRYGDRSLFYGPLSEVMDAGSGDNRFIIAYVLSKVANDHRFIGYRGTVISLLRDEQRFPAKIVLKDAAVFYLDIDGDIPVRKEQAESLDWITLHAEAWHNVAFKVFEVIDDPAPVSEADPAMAHDR